MNWDGTGKLVFLWAQNHKKVEEETSGDLLPNPLLSAGSARAGCPELCPSGF